MTKIHLAHSYGSGEPKGGRAHNGNYGIKTRHHLDLRKGKVKNKALDRMKEVRDRISKTKSY